PGQSYVPTRETKVTLSIQSAPLKQVLQEIERQSHLHFFYNTNQINNKRKVSLELSDSIDKVLNTLFAKTDVLWRIEGRQVLLWKKEQKVPKVDPYRIPTSVTTPLPEAGVSYDAVGLIPEFQTLAQRVRGTVTDQSGAALPGV